MLTQIRVAVFSTPPTHGDHDLVVDLSAGPIPGAPIETLETTILDGDARVYAFNSVLHPMLLAGQTYWIVLTSNDLVDNSFGWNFSNSWQFTTMAERGPGVSLWQPFYDSTPAFEVSGQSGTLQSVPEPGMMLGAGLALLLLVGLRRQRQPAA